MTNLQNSTDEACVFEIADSGSAAVTMTEILDVPAETGGIDTEEFAVELTPSEIIFEIKPGDSAESAPSANTHDGSFFYSAKTEPSLTEAELTIFSQPDPSEQGFSDAFLANQGTKSEDEYEGYADLETIEDGDGQPVEIFIPTDSGAA